MASWDPEIYARDKAYRDRPALDLLMQIPDSLGPRVIWDLGCGAGEHAALLARRHPGARVFGLDSSPEMLARARSRSEAVTWVEGDIAAFAPPEPPDLIFSNAALHWLPRHDQLLPRLVSSLAPGGILACQMPVAFESLHHEVLRQVAKTEPWAGHLQRLAPLRPTPALENYYGWLSDHCREVDLWSTTYLHVLQGEDPVVDWMTGTALLPYLDALPDPRLRSAFLGALGDSMADAFPARADGTTLLPLPRLFILATRT
ncbi:MAG: methyltransferase domain-containing protein [Caulobacter sp.]|nr:methyltransferase domain-containing protein [Caulobacter sp.]